MSYFNHITVDRAHKCINEEKKSEAIFFDLNVNGVTIYGCRYATGKNGDFVSFPSVKRGDKYYNHAYVKLSDADVRFIKGCIDSVLEAQ